MFRILLLFSILSNFVYNLSKVNSDVPLFLSLIKDEYHEKLIGIQLAGRYVTMKVHPVNTNGRPLKTKSQSSGSDVSQSRNCFYEGELIEIPGSFIHLFACEFMRGVIEIDKDNRYLIDKMDKSSTKMNDYILKKLEKKSINPKILDIDNTINNLKGLDVKEEAEKLFSESRENGYRFTKLDQTQGDISYAMSIEFLVDTYYFEIIAGRNKRFVVDAVSNLMVVIGDPFAGERISVTCGQLVIDDLYDTVLVSPDLDSTVIAQQMLLYRRFFLSNAGYLHVTYLLSGHPIIELPTGSFSAVVYRGSICTSLGVGLLLDFTEDPYTESRLIFWLLYTGFNANDDGPNCQCNKPGGCIADPNLDTTKLRTKGAVGLSTCTYQAFRTFAQSSGLCFFVKLVGPLPTNPYCGNFVLEEGEQCDCGGEQNCKGSRQDNICKWNTCKMASKEYDCNEGDCCTPSYKFRPAGVPCTNFALTICDFYEGCSGKHPYCPRDTWALDGTPCGTDKTGTCDLGICVKNHGTKRTFARKCSIKCNNHGICNNRWNCHCEPGYICLECVPSPGAPGGSIDSGAQCLSTDDTSALLLGELVGAILIILFLNVLPLIMTISYLLYSHCSTLGIPSSQYGQYSVADF